MSSIKLHLAISKKLKEYYSFSNAFLLGSILPDIYKVMLKESEIRKSHFEEYENGQYLPNIDKFCSRYINNKSEIIFGYLAHLQQDRMWFKDFCAKYAKVINKNECIYLKDNTIHKVEEYRKDMYNDYSIIDSYIKEKYDVDIKKIKYDIKQYVSDKQILEIIDKKMIEYESINDNLVFLTKEEVDKYFNEAYIQTKVILDEFIGLTKNI